MNASDALKLTREALDGQTGAISVALQSAFARIKECAAKGERSVANPVRGLAYPQVRMAYEHLKTLGYRVDHSSDQRDGDEWTVSW
jgi:hypothetical protein